MDIKTVTLVYFSPTGTTKKVLEGIVGTINAQVVRTYDLTKPESETCVFEEIDEGLVILGAPVYGGRIPMEAERRFRRVKGKGVPAVVVVVYGNREYDDALIEMRELAKEQGVKPIAAAAFIGEHSYSTEKSPLSAGRPDAYDINIARDMGKQLARKVAAAVKADTMREVAVPGNLPLKERHEMKRIPPVTDKAVCTKCGACAGSCPTGAITVADTVETKAESCILCSACVKICPVSARTLSTPQVEKARAWLSETCKEPKSPVIFMD
jgi:ferredoxin